MPQTTLDGHAYAHTVLILSTCPPPPCPYFMHGKTDDEALLIITIMIRIEAAPRLVATLE